MTFRFKTFRVGEWVVDGSLNQIAREDDPQEVVRLEPKAMEVLSYLAERAGEVVDKESVIRDVWEGAFVTNEVLTNAVWELRRALGDDARSAVFIQTIPKRGYRLVAPVSGLQTPAPAVSRRAPLAALVAGGLLLVGLTAFSLIPEPPPRPVTRFSVEASHPLASFYLPTIALSPDATLIVYATEDSGLFVRSRDRWESTPLLGTRGANGPFFSPDGRSLGFFAERHLKTVPIDGAGPPVAVTEIVAARGASWADDGFIYVAPASDRGLYRVREQGGALEPVTELDENTGEWTHRWPEVLPGAEAVLFTVALKDLQSFDDASIHAVDVATGRRRLVIERASFPRYASGWLFYAREGQVLAAPFDPDALRITGPSRSASGDVKLYPINGAAQLSLSREGSLVYVPSLSEHDPARRLVWIDRKGLRTSVLEEARLYYDPSLSRDGSKLAVSIATLGNSDLWVYDVERETLTRLTTSGGEEEHPLFTPGGGELAYDYSMAGPFRVLARSTGGGGEERELVGSSSNSRPESFSPDGRYLVFSEENPRTGFDLHLLDLDEGRARRPLLVTSFDERHARISPEGRFFAYASNESGRFEVYVTSFPVPGARLQISVDGGEQGEWTRGGSEILFLGQDGMMAVSMGTPARLTAEKPRKLFDWKAPYRVLEGTYRKHFDVAADGERLLAIEPARDPAASRLHVVLDGRAELEGGAK